jgi:hypothetical protein
MARIQAREKSQMDRDLRAEGVARLVGVLPPRMQKGKKVTKLLNGKPCNCLDAAFTYMIE